MTETGIHGLDVEYAGSGKSKAISRVVVRFGDGHSLEVASSGGKARVRLVNQGLAVVLPTDGPGCAFGCAVNILRLYMPSVKAGPENS
jgi:hypothetical protein